jgi:ATP-dependent helicase/nuclease subunit B
MAVVLVKDLPRFSGAPREEIAARIAAGRNDSFFYIAPTRRKVRRLQREFLTTTPSGVSGPFSIFTLGTLAGALFEILLPPRKRLGDRLRAAVVQEAIRSSAPDLGYFTLRGPARRLPRGTLARITNVLDRLKASGVYLSRIQEEIGEGGPGERLKLRDIALIYGTYERLLAEGGYVDPPGLVEAVNLEWTKPGSDVRFRERHPGVDLLCVTGFDEFSDPELTLLGYLSGVPGLGTVVSFDYHPDNDDLFGHLKENYTKLLAMGFAAAGSPVRGMSPFHAHIARKLFAPPAAKSAEPEESAKGKTFDATSIVTACPAPDRVREAELIAKIIKTEIADTPGLGPGDVCVCMPRPALYSAIFREVFEQAEIPANVTDRFYLEESSVVTGILSMLQVAQNNFRIEDIMRAGTNPFLRIPAGGGTFDAANLLRTASELRTVSGRKRWVERIEARMKFVRGAHPGDEGPGTRRAIAEAARLNDARRDLDALDRLVSGFRMPMRPGEFRDAVVRLADTLGVAASLAAAGSSGVRTADVERESRAYAEFLRFLDEFPEVLAIESPPGEAHPLSWHLERFRPLLSQVRYNVKQRYGEGVLVTSIDETRGLSFRVMVVAGLVDGEFPSVYEPEVFLTPRSRERRERCHLHEQRYLFYQALSGCSGRIYLTRPLKQNGVDLNPSGFLEWLEAAASIAKHGPDSEQPFAETIVTADEALARMVGDTDPAGTPGGRVPGPEIPDHVRTAIAAEEARRSDAGGDLFRGLIDPAALPAKAATRLAAYRNGTYSVTQLETYGDCPFRFFAGRVLGLRVPEEPEEGVTPREMGKLLHEIMYDFYSDRRDRGLPPIAGIDDDGFAGAVAALKEIAARKFDEASVDDVFWEISRETVIGSPGSPGAPGRPGTLEAMLAGERDSGVSAAPAWFEVRFGRAGEDLKYSDPGMFSDAPAPAGGIFLQGKIDRIDADGDAFSVVDYKTGSSVPSKKDVDDGASLQLPLYLHCAEWLLSERLGRTMTGGAGLYYHLKPEFEAIPRIGNAEYKGRLLDPVRKFKLAADAAALGRLGGAAAATAADPAERISRGLFPVEPRDPAKLCRSCDFRRMCRIRTRMSPDPGPAEEDGHDNNDH